MSARAAAPPAPVGLAGDNLPAVTGATSTVADEQRGGSTLGRGSRAESRTGPAWSRSELPAYSYPASAGVSTACLNLRASATSPPSCCSAGDVAGGATALHEQADH